MGDSENKSVRPIGFSMYYTMQSHKVFELTTLRMTRFWLTFGSTLSMRSTKWLVMFVSSTTNFWNVCGKTDHR